MFYKKLSLQFNVTSLLRRSIEPVLFRMECKKEKAEHAMIYLHRCGSLGFDYRASEVERCVTNGSSPLRLFSGVGLRKN